ncbi:MAG: hypothetical protein AAF614_08110 [Chloroflexota bacterium]
MTDIFQKQLKDVVTEYDTVKERSRFDDASDVLSDVQVNDLQTRCLAAIERAAGRKSVYFERAIAILDTNNHSYGHLAGQIGVAKSLLSDLQNGYLKSLEEIIHGDVFGDFLEMSDHLNNSGYKNAAAVLAGSTLEAHIRQLCNKHSVTITQNGKLKKADTLNADLVKTNVYSKLDQKNVTAWLGLRNNAAHGHYSAYDKNQVALLISGIRDFVTRHPA